MPAGLSGLADLASNIWLTMMMGSAMALPLVGVAVRSLARRLLIVAGVTGVLAALASLGWAGQAGAPTRVALAHVTFAAAACALVAVGAFCRAACRDVLDAAACSVAVALVATFGLLACGQSAGDVPTPIVNAALLINPVVATTSAADIDLLRSDLLYRLSPIAHRRFDYPDRATATLLFSAIAIAGLGGAAAVDRARAGAGLPLRLPFPTRTS